MIAAIRRRLDDSLFRDPPGGGSASDRLPVLLIGGGLFVLAILLQMLRIGWSPSLHSLWAEDGAIYLSGAVHNSFGGSLFDTYATYLVFVPRLIAELADLFPLADAPAVLTVLSCAVVALSGLIVFVASRGLIESPYLRGGLALLIVLAPVGGLESTASAAYVPWYMLFATFWILLWRPRTAPVALGAGVFALLTGMSTPGVWFFIPLALLRTLATRDGRDALLLAGYWAGALVQLPVLIFNDETAVTPQWTHDIWTAYLERVIAGAALGLRIPGKLWEEVGWVALIAILAIVVIALVYGISRTNFSARLFALIAIPTSLVMFVVSVYQRAVGTEMLWPDGDFVESAGRYAIVPAMLLVSVAAVMLDRRQRRREAETRPRWLAYAALAAALVVVGFSFRVENTELRGAPPWEAALDSGAEICATDPGATESPIPTSPPGWGLNVPCGQLSSFGP
jgi:hypothetical protein